MHNLRLVAGAVGRLSVAESASTILDKWPYSEIRSPTSDSEYFAMEAKVSSALLPPGWCRRTFLDSELLAYLQLGIHLSLGT